MPEFKQINFSKLFFYNFLILFWIDVDDKKN